MSSTNPFDLKSQDQQRLLTLARASIDHGLQHGSQLRLKTEDFPTHLQTVAATFITLKLEGELRGCIGSLEAYQALVLDIAQNAYAAAFHDSRFPVLTSSEFAGLDIHIAILSPAERMTVTSEHDLVAQLRPAIDGLIIASEGHRATFLPSVWAQLPEPQQFLSHLKQKAGLPSDYWSQQMQIWRYTASSFSTIKNT